jgi:hypothetical protein
VRAREGKCRGAMACCGLITRSLSRRVLHDPLSQTRVGTAVPVILDGGGVRGDAGGRGAAALLRGRRDAHRNLAAAEAAAATATAAMTCSLPFVTSCAYLLHGGGVSRVAHRRVYRVAAAPACARTFRCVCGAVRRCARGRLRRGSDGVFSQAIACLDASHCEAHANGERHLCAVHFIPAMPLRYPPLFEPFPTGAAPLPSTQRV